MSNIYKGEMQDYEGNTVYPHTEADVVFCTDGTTAQSKLNKYENALGSVTGKTDSLEVSDSNVVASAKAVNTLNTNMGGLKFGKDGDGNYGYYGADGSLIPFSGINSSEIVKAFNGNAYTVGEDVKKCIVVALQKGNGWDTYNSMDITTKTGIKDKTLLCSLNTGWDHYSSAVSVWYCKTIPGGQIKVTASSGTYTACIFCVIAIE